MPDTQMLAAALVALAERNIPTDIQELLTTGDPMRGIPPHALNAALTAALAGHVVVPREPTPEMLRRGSAMKLDTALAPGHPELKENGGKYSTFELMSLETWRVMIDAAPPVSRGE